MSYKLFNSLFGWDYIAWANTADQGVSRVRVLPDGTVFYWRYKNTKVSEVIGNPKQVLWLTCDPAKYFRARRVEPPQ